MRWQDGPGNCQYEVDAQNQYTGWYRYIDGKLTDGRWLAWHQSGITRYSYG